MLEVIIVDDDQIVLFIQSKMLINHNITPKPINFKKARAALEYLSKKQQQKQKKDFLIFLDINMPKMNGWDFLDVLEKHEENANYHIIMVTSSINIEDKVKATSYSAVRSFIEKPISASDCKKIKEIPEIKHFFTA